MRRLESALGPPLIINQSGVLTLTEYERMAAESTSVHLKGIDLMPDYLGIQEVISGKYDYGLLPHPIDHPDLAEVPIYSDCLFAWVPDTNPLYGNETIANDDLADFQLIFPSNDPEWANLFSEFVRRSIPRARLKAVDEMFMALRCAAQGEGIGITTRACVDPIEMRGIRGIPLIDMPWGFSLCFRKDRALTPADHEFIAFMERVGLTSVVKTGCNRPYVPEPTRRHSANVPEGLLRQNADYQNQNARATASKRDSCLIIGQFFPQSEHRVDFHSENRHFGARLPAKGCSATGDVDRPQPARPSTAAPSRRNRPAPRCPR